MLAMLFCAALVAQEADYAIISSIQVEGNKKTKQGVVLREMDLAIGDTLFIATMTEDIDRNRQYIFNTSLFEAVNINVKNWDTEAKTLNLLVEVVEDWYIYPIPIFALADRNFNVWLKEFNGSLNRVNYGLRFYHFNTTGNADILRFIAQFGYEKRFELRYNRPYINKAQTLGWSNSISLRSRKEVFYATENNKQSFLTNDDENQLESTRLRSILTYRPEINDYHALELEYIKNTVADTVAQFLNPDYFLNGQSTQQYFNLKYVYTRDWRNFRTYATKGSLLKVSLHKQGLGIFGDVNQLRFESSYAKYIELTPSISIETLARARYSFNRKQQPFANYRAVGFNQNDIRGYELYVLDALDFGYLSTSLRFRFIDTSIDFGKIIPISRFRTLPIQVMFTINNDVGYTNDPFYADANPLGNQWLWGGGVGLDIMMFEDFVFQVEYNFNHLWERGLYFKAKVPF